LFAAPRVYVRDSDKLNVGHRQNLFEQFLSPCTHANHGNANAIIRAEHSWSWISSQRRCADSGLLDEFASRVRCHMLTSIGD
jgi:hypothetical protein